MVILLIGLGRHTKELLWGQLGWDPEAKDGEGVLVAVMPVLRQVVKLKVNRRDEGIERFFLAQAPNQYSQHMADWVHIFLPSLPLPFNHQKLIPSISPHFSSFNLRGYQAGMYCRQMPGNINLAYSEAGRYWLRKIRWLQLWEPFHQQITLSQATHKIHILFRKWKKFPRWCLSDMFT